jgi:diguanylate cyclase (GGDEF)-like protein
VSKVDTTTVKAGARSFGEPDTETQPGSRQGSPVDELLHEIHTLDEKDSGIWAKHLLLMVVLCAGFLALIFPNLAWNLGQLEVDSRYVPQFFFGLIALVILYNAHIIEQRRKLRYAREETVRQLLRAESSETLTLVDPLTQVYNRRHLDKILPRETSRADRSGATLSLMMIDLDDFKSVNTRFGHVMGDQVLRDVAGLLNKVFRRSDTVIRYGGDEFLIVMPDTNEEQAAHAVSRLHEEVAMWNQTNPGRGYSLGLSCGTAAYRKGTEIRKVLEAADERMYAEKASHDSPARLGSHS